LIYSSTLNRALKTAEIIRDCRDIEIIPCEELKEIRLGPWEGFTLNEIKERYPKEYELFFTKPEFFKCEGCETFFDVKERVVKCIERIISEKKECMNILIVSHAVVIRTALVYFENRGIDSIWKGEIQHAGLVIVEVSDNKRKVIQDILDEISNC
jgi:probable phosphoglycerate mutase